MPERHGESPTTQPIGSAVLVVTMEVDPADEAEFNRWYNEQHLPERMEIPGYISARRFKLIEGEGALTYLCIWELADGSPLQSQMYQDQQADPTALYLRVNQTIKARTRGLYRQIFPPAGAYANRTGFHPRHQEFSA